MSLSARSLFSSETALLAVLTVYVVVLGLWPLARLFVEALLPAAGGERARRSAPAVAEPRDAARADQHAGSERAGDAGVGCDRRAAAFVLTLTDVRGKAALTFVALLPLLVPSQITALAWIELTGVAARSSGRSGSRPRRARPIRSIPSGASCW